MSENNRIKKLIFDEIAKSGRTANQVAAHAGVDSSVITRLRQRVDVDKYGMTVETLAKLLKALNLPWAVLDVADSNPVPQVPTPPAITPITEQKQILFHKGNDDGLPSGVLNA